MVVRQLLPCVKVVSCRARKYFAPVVYYSTIHVVPREHTKISQIQTLEKSMAVFRDLSTRDVPITTREYTSLLQTCIKEGALTEANELYTHMIDSKFEPDQAVSNLLVRLYATCGKLNKAMDMFQIMISKGYIADDYTYTNLFTSCVKNKALRLGLVVHEHMKKVQHDPNIVTYTALINFYVKCDQLDKAMDIFREITDKKLYPNQFTYSTLLNGCANTKALKRGTIIHEYMLLTKYNIDLHSGTALIRLYTGCKQLPKAMQVFHDLINRNVSLNDFTYSILYTGCADAHALQEGITVNEHMVKTRHRPDIVTYTALIRLYAECKQLSKAMQVFQKIINEKIAVGEFTYSILLTGCADVKALEEGIRVHNHMDMTKFKLTLITYNALVRLYAECGQLDKAMNVFQDMINRNISPNHFTYTILLKGCANAKALQEGVTIHEHMVKHGHNPDIFTLSTLIRLYAECEQINKATDIFQDVINRNLSPDEFTYTILLNGCAKCRSESGEKIFQRIPAKMLRTSIHVANAAIDMFCKLMDPDRAQQIFDGVEHKDTILWNTMIMGYGIDGNGHKALSLFDQMVEQRVQPSTSTFVNVLSACSHSQLHEEALNIFRSMKQRFQIEPDEQIHTIIVDTLSRSGQLEKAIKFATSMEKPSFNEWVTILGGCRTFKNVELGEYAAERALSLNNEDSSVYVLLSNIYADAKMYEKAKEIRGKMENLGLKKEPGITTIEHDGVRYEFKAQKPPAELVQEINEARGEFLSKLFDAGYVVDTSVVTDNVDEETKKAIACQHSEKNALVFKLGRTRDQTTPIKMYKNLRICNDCHAATAIASKVYQREIHMQDARRSHRFVNGKCSCGGKW
jgi:pentatricopeptide repeat protein